MGGRRFSTLVQIHQLDERACATVESQKDISYPIDCQFINHWLSHIIIYDSEYPLVLFLLPTDIKSPCVNSFRPTSANGFSRLSWSCNKAFTSGRLRKGDPHGVPGHLSAENKTCKKKCEDQSKNPILGYFGIFWDILGIKTSKFRGLFPISCFKFWCSLFVSRFARGIKLCQTILFWRDASLTHPYASRHRSFLEPQ